MSKIDAKKLVKKYAQGLKEANFPFFAVYLFGSYAKGESRKWSDIDVAVVSDEFKRNWEKNELTLWRIRRKIDTRIEPHGFTTKEFKDKHNPMAYEIKKTGVRVV
jgi:predicted nucleotidyltransferase